MKMGDQRFTCGRYKNRTFEEIAKNDADFCESVLKTEVCSKYYPEEFKSYLLSVRRTSIRETNVTSFIKKWDENMEAEFRKIIGSPSIEIKSVHSQSSIFPSSNLGVFIRYFVKKCIFNIQQSDATSYSVETFAAIFPFKVSKTVPLAKLPVRELFDEKFYATISAFMEHHFEDKYDSVVDLVDLFLRNVHDFRRKHFDEYAIRRLKKVVDDAVDPDKSLCITPYANNDYLRHFPRLSPAGVARYSQLRQMYNNLCAAFGREDLGDQRRRHIRMLPEVNCYELLLLLEPDFFQERARYVELFQKYLFFFAYAVECEENPLFFIDDPLYECLKEYIQYRNSRDVPENLKLCIWMVTLVHRRMQPLHYKSFSDSYDVDDDNLEHIRKYVENFPGIESAVVDFVLPTSLLLLGIPIVTKDTVFNVFYSNAEKSNLTDFYEGIIRASMCPLNIKRVTIYNAYNGQETSMELPPVKREVLEFVRRLNKYDPTSPLPVEQIFTENMEQYFERDTIQWHDKYPRKSNTLPVYDYKDVFGDD